MTQHTRKPVTATYRLDEDQFLDACNEHWNSNRQGSYSNFAIGLVAILGGISFLSLTLWLGTVLIAVGSMLILMIFFRSYMWRRHFRDTRYQAGNTTVSFEDNAIHVDLPGGSSVLDWNFYESFMETEEFFILYMNRKAAHFSVIPKKAFTEQQVRELSELLSEKLKEIRQRWTS